MQPENSTFSSTHCSAESPAVLLGAESDSVPVTLHTSLCERGIAIIEGNSPVLCQRDERRQYTLQKHCYLTQKHTLSPAPLPQPGCVNTTEMDIRKCRRERNPHRVKKVRRDDEDDVMCDISLESPNTFTCSANFPSHDPPTQRL